MAPFAVRLRLHIASMFGRAKDALTDPGTRARSRRYIIMHSASANVTANLIGGNFIVGLYTVLNINDALLGTLTAIAQLCNIAQLLSPLLLGRFAKKKMVIVALRGAYHGFSILMIGLIPFFPIADGGRVAILVLATIIANLSAAMAGPGIGLLHIKSIPQRIRADFFSVMTLMNTVLVHTFVLIGGRIVDHFRDSGSLLTGITVVRVIALALAVCEIIADIRVHEFVDKKATTEKARITIPFRDRKFMICCMLVGAWSFLANMPGLYFSSYLINDLRVPFSFIGLVNMLSVPAFILFTPIWNRVIKRLSWYRSASVALLLFSLHYLSLSLVAGGNYLYLYPIAQALNFCTIPCINIVFANMPYLNLPREGGDSAFAFYAANNSFMAMLGLFSGGLWFSLTRDYELSLFGAQLVTKQYMLLFVGACIAVLGGMFYVKRGQE